MRWEVTTILRDFLPIQSRLRFFQELVLIDTFEECGIFYAGKGKYLKSSCTKIFINS